MKSAKILILLIFFSFNIFSLEAQKGMNGKMLTLDQCIRITLINNPNVKLAEAKLNPAQADLMSSIGDFLPRLGFNMGYRRTLDDTIYASIEGAVLPFPVSDPNSFSMSMFASYPIFNGFAREARYSIAENGVEVSNINLKRTKRVVTLDVYHQYIDIIRKSQILKAKKESLVSGEKELERINAQYNAGVISVGDVYSQQAALGSRELDVVTAENDLRKAKAVLLATMGMYPDANIDFNEASIPNNIEPEELRQFKLDMGNYKDALRQALENRLDYKATEININSAEANVSAANSSYYPSLSASGGWSWNNRSFDEFQLGSSSLSLNLSVPLFNNFDRNASVQGAKLSLYETELAKRNAEQGIRTELQAAFLNLESVEKMLDITERNLKSAQQNFESTKERFHVGAVSITDFTIANNQLVTAQINRINAVYNYFKSQKEILFVVGTL